MPQKTPPWLELSRFRDPTVPKLDNLRRAAAAGLRVPETWWLAPRGLAVAPEAVPPPEALADRPLILRSGSPTEDTQETSNAGQLLSLPVDDPREPGRFGAALASVVAALPRDGAGRPLGAVFVQPLVRGREAGIAFFDGFYYERTMSLGSNEGLTAGQARGTVERGTLERGDPWSEWLVAVHQVFSRETPRLDLELVATERGYVLLQARPALFPLTRNETLSLANHKEILGDPPSPWIAAALVAAGEGVLAFFAAVDPEVGRWEEHYAVALGERAWMNFSFFFRLMDRWGLPRTFVTEGAGGESGGPADRRVLWRRFLARSPRLVRLQGASLREVRRAPAGLADLDERIAAAETLPDLFAVTARALALAIRTNFAINSLFTGIERVRRALHLSGGGRVVTRDMMEEYAALGALPPEAREAGLDRWLAAYGHRGPLESDPAQPRFAELRPLLLADLAASTLPAAASPNRVSGPSSGPSGGPSGLVARLTRPFYRIEEIREDFRDQLMRRFAHLRARILAAAARRVAAGDLDAPEDVFLLRGFEIAEIPTGSLRAAVAAARERVERARSFDLPPTASRTAIEAVLVRVEESAAVESGRRIFPGIPLSPAVVEGRAVKAADLPSLLAATARSGGIAADSILVVPALEPSWAVVFPRFLGVVAELGGELSHASILLREARRPAIVNCAGIFRAVKDGDRLRLDGGHGWVELVSSDGA